MLSGFAKYRMSSSTLLAAASGVLLALSFPQPGLSILAWVALVPLLAATRDKPFSDTFKLSFVAGFVAYIGIFYWLNIVMTTYGKLPLAASFCLTLLMAAYLALYVALSAGAARLAVIAGFPLSAALPFFWVTFEYIRAFFLTGFPWATLGYTQFRTLPLIQTADITGVYGISFLIIFANVVLFDIATWVKQSGKSRYPFVSSSILALLLTLSLGYGFTRLNRPESGRLVKVALAQGNIPQDIKWNPAFQEETISIYERLSRSVADKKVDLVVWPESSLPFFFQEETLNSLRISALAKELTTSLVVSSPAREIRGGKERLLNSAFLLAADGSVTGRADKVHLVPFGEYVPMQNLLPFVNKLVHGIGDFSPGAETTPLATPYGKIGILVCFEGIFPEISREYVRKGAVMLVNITNDAWFGRSSAPYQHLSMTVFRAIENRVPLVRAANTGISTIIDSNGHILRMTGLFTEEIISGEVRTGDAATFYNKLGDVFAWICIIVSCGVAVLVARRTNKPDGCQ
jgi:apolipoprotein N-acyltransferase